MQFDVDQTIRRGERRAFLAEGKPRFDQPGIARGLDGSTQVCPRDEQVEPSGPRDQASDGSVR